MHIILNIAYALSLVFTAYLTLIFAFMAGQKEMGGPSEVRFPLIWSVFFLVVAIILAKNL